MLKQFFKRYGWRYLPGAAFLIICAWLNTRSPLILGRAIDFVRLQDWDLFIREIWMMLAVALGVFIT
ncbi:MAG: ABC transporter ATP-binding protein, partial [Christensenellales bacterium]